MAENMSRRQHNDEKQKLEDKEAMISPEVCLSNLPDDMLSHILSFLNLKEAFRTRLVSRRWRYLSVPIHHLNFDSELIFGCDHRANNSKSSARFLQGQFVERVERLLASIVTKHCQNLLSFKVSFFLGKESAPLVDEWIRYAVRMESESIELDFIFLSENVPVQRDEIELFDFPCHLLPLGEGSNLKHLCIKECILRPSHEQANRFNFLKSLKLVNVALKDSEIEVILSGCLKLEMLEFIICKMPSTLTICGQVPCLKWLHVERCRGLEKIEISSVGLHTFEFSGSDTKFSFSDVPMLTEVYVRHWCMNQNGWDYICDGELARGLPHLQNLNLLRSVDNKLDFIPENMMTEFNCLKRLMVQLRASSDFDLFEITHLLHACPVLESFQICLVDLVQGSVNRAIQFKDFCRGQWQPYRHLKEVGISGLWEQWNAVGFATHLLKNAVALERMIVSLNWKVYCWRERRFRYCRRDTASLNADQLYNLLVKERGNSRAELIVI